MREEESPTRYMLPEQAEGDYSLHEHSPAKKKRKKKDKKDKKAKPGKSVHFQSKVRLKTIYQTLKDRIEDLDLANEEDYPFRTTAFALKRKGQKELLKYQHQYRPLTPRRQLMLNHIRETLQRVNEDFSSPSQTLPKTSTQTLS